MWARATAAAKAARAARLATGLDDPGLDALRVDVVVDAVLGLGPQAAGHTDPTAPPRLPRCSCGGAQTAAVVLDLPTALGLAENPGHLPGYGAVPADLARAMAADLSFRLGPLDRRTPHRAPAGPRRPHLPPLRPAPRIHRRPRPDLRVPRLLPRRHHLRPRPRPAVRTTQHGGRQPRPAVPPAPQRQDPRPMATHPRPRHPHQDLELTPGPDLPHAVPTAAPVRWGGRSTGATRLAFSAARAPPARRR